jgi:PAS domain S-box-containing protein
MKTLKEFKELQQLTSVRLENEMDLIIAHKRSMKLAELCGFSVSAQTAFATAVSEIARVAMGRKKTKMSELALFIRYALHNKKIMLAEVLIHKEELEQASGQEALIYAKRLVGEVAVSDSAKDKKKISLSLQIQLGGLLTEEKVNSFIDYFKKEPPISAYDEIRKRNIQLISLSEKLKESENDYRKITETLPMMMFTLNSVGKIMRANKWTNNFFEQKLEGLLWYTFLYPEDQKDALKKWEQAQLEKTSLNIQARLKHKSTFVWHMITLVPLQDKFRNITEWAGFFVDIHAQKLVEETLKNNIELQRIQKELIAKNDELRTKNEFVETILDSSVDLIGVYDTEMRILAFNKKCEQIYRMKKEEVLGRKFTEVFPHSEDSQAYRDLSRAIRGQMIHNVRYRAMELDKYYENYLIPLRDLKGEIYGVLLIAHDITDKVEYEQQLKTAYEKLQKSNSELEQFAYIASHDLQEPLRKIRNFSEQLGQNIDVPALREKYLSKIDSSADRMTALINAVLHYSRLSAMENEEVHVDLNEVLNNVKADYELIIEEKKATVNSNKLPVIRANSLQMHQLFSNLIGNALKFNDRSPVIHISAAGLKSSMVKDRKLDEKRNYISIKFKDNGIGFEQKYAEKIFTIFQRLGNKNDYSGTGIGLALCKKIVDKHQGQISATSTLNKGAEFEVVLPLN